MSWLDAEGMLRRGSVEAKVLNAALGNGQHWCDARARCGDLAADCGANFGQGHEVIVIGIDAAVSAVNVGVAIADWDGRACALRETCQGARGRMCDWLPDRFRPSGPFGLL